MSGDATTLERLWNGWRASYVQSQGECLSGAGRGTSADHTGGDAAPQRSVFAEILDSGLPDTDTHIVHRGASVFVICNRFPYSVGHVLVLPYRQVAELEDLTDDEVAELWPTVTVAVTTLKAIYRPEGINVGVNLGRPAGGSISQHLHVHVVPRWIGDANFMTATANTRTLPEALPDTAQRLRDAWGAVS